VGVRTRWCCGENFVSPQCFYPSHSLQVEGHIAINHVVTSLVGWLFLVAS